MEDKTILDSTVDGKYLMYKGRPLVRGENIICYGFMEDPYILQMTIMTTKEVGGKEVPDKILIQIVKTDATLSARERIVKQDMKSGLYEAFDLGIIWLERYLG
ncbi:MAG: hypothetical protein IJZ08_02525 [Clostridia bacterium]|nr:hypothetical protein [Clostridia bacterium]